MSDRQAVAETTESNWNANNLFCRFHFLFGNKKFNVRRDVVAVVVSGTTMIIEAYCVLVAWLPDLRLCTVHIIWVWSIHIINVAIYLTSKGRHRTQPFYSFCLGLFRGPLYLELRMKVSSTVWVCLYQLSFSSVQRLIYFWPCDNKAATVSFIRNYLHYYIIAVTSMR